MRTKFRENISSGSRTDTCGQADGGRDVQTDGRMDRVDEQIGLPRYWCKHA